MSAVKMNKFVNIEKSALCEYPWSVFQSYLTRKSEKCSKESKVEFAAYTLIFISSFSAVYPEAPANSPFASRSVLFLCCYPSFSSLASRVPRVPDSRVLSELSECCSDAAAPTRCGT